MEHGKLEDLLPIKIKFDIPIYEEIDKWFIHALLSGYQYNEKDRALLYGSKCNDYEKDKEVTLEGIISIQNSTIVKDKDTGKERLEFSTIFSGKEKKNFDMHYEFTQKMVRHGIAKVQVIDKAPKEHLALGAILEHITPAIPSDHPTCHSPH
jgi:hypothetical protein